ncbi:hypothetical protein BVX99_01095 [bacterium F16]|nr:hypothetical protein BVX99_01095 [bacterium F16]
MSLTQLTPDYIQGAISIEPGEGYLKPWRTNYLQTDLFPSVDDRLLERMASPVGVRVRFTTKSTTVTLSMLPSKRDRLYDLVINATIRETKQVPAGETSITFNDLPGDETPVDIWLAFVDSTSLTTLAGESVQPAADPRTKWLTYGSSITQCNESHSPARSWPGTVARACDLNLTCLGFAGQCHLDSMIARLIRDRDVDLLTMKLGINMLGAASLSPRTFKGAVIGFVQIIRETHPDIPIGIISPIISPPRETTPNAVRFTLSAMREELIDAVDRIKRVAGDDRIFYFNGLDIFGNDLVADYLPDDLHPNGDGYEIMGRNVAERIMPTLMAEL